MTWPKTFSKPRSPALGDLLAHADELGPGRQQPAVSMAAFALTAT